MKPMILPAVGVFGLVMLAVVRVDPPSDLGSWTDGALPGQIVAALDAGPTGLVVATRDGLHRLDGDGTTDSLGIPGAVHDVVSTDLGDIWAGTDDGALLLAPDAAETSASLAGDPVRSLDTDGAQVLAGSDTGVHRLGPQGDWERLWPTGNAGGTPVDAVLGTSRGVLFAHPDGLALLTAEGRTQVVVPDGDVVALGRWSADGSVWVGLRAGSLLLHSADGGSTWSPRSDGLGYNAVHDVAADPAAQGHLIVGGSGLADGDGNAGTQVSRDDGSSWTAEQDRLTNTHVYALVARTEPVRLTFRVAGSDLRATMPLPTTTTRWYAGTNGGGISTLSTPIPALETLAGAAPYLRLAEPVLGGILLLTVLVPAYRHLARNRTPVPRGPPDRVADPTVPPQHHDTTQENHETHTHPTRSAGKPRARRDAHAHRLRRLRRGRDRGGSRG